MYARYMCRIHLCTHCYITVAVCIPDPVLINRAIDRSKVHRPKKKKKRKKKNLIKFALTFIFVPRSFLSVLFLFLFKVKRKKKIMFTLLSFWCQHHNWISDIWIIPMFAWLSMLWPHFLIQLPNTSDCTCRWSTALTTWISPFLGFPFQHLTHPASGRSLASGTPVCAPVQSVSPTSLSALFVQ